MSKVFILEDAPERIKIFQKKLKEHELYFFDNVKEAKTAIDLLGPFDYYFLDHDLDNRVYVDSNEENTGYQLAKYMAEKEVTGEIVIHSMNPAGRLNMSAVLINALIVPFCNLFE